MMVSGILRSHSLVRLIWGATILLTVVTTAALINIGLAASGEADALATQNEKTLLSNVLNGRFHAISRDQFSVARLDRSVENIVHRFDRRFAQKEIVDPLWNDFSLQFNFIVATNGTVLLEAREDEVEFPSEPRKLEGDLEVLRQRAIERFQRNRVGDSGVRQRPVQAAQIGEIAEVGFVEIRGRPALASAIPFVPEEGHGASRSDVPPVILLSLRLIDGAFVTDIGAELGFTDLTFDRDRSTYGMRWPVEVVGGRQIGDFVWSSASPGLRIWNLIIPLILASVVILTLVAVLIARRMSRMSRHLEASEAHNRYIARHDGLTGLASRLEINERLAAATARLPEHPFAWIACDLDRFKAVNDTFGHAAGDAVLETIAVRLAETVGSDGIVGRIGGDEFVILVTAFHDRPRLTILGRAIISQVETPVLLDGGAQAAVGISLGIVLVAETTATPDGIATAADRALYRAKAGGRGCVVFAHEVAGHGDVGAEPTVTMIETARSAVGR